MTIGTTSSITLSGTGGYNWDTAPVVTYTFNDVQGNNSVKVEVAKNEINPRLYFKYVKSKFTKIEIQKLEEKIKKLKQIIVDAKEVHQKALYEHAAQAIAIAFRESEAYAIGCDKFITKEYIEKFKNKVQEKPVYFKKLEEFPRPIPKNIAAKIKRVRDKAVFDDYWVLYLDYARESEKVKTNKQKIREKDPVLFGTFAYQPDRFYFILDWIDDYCDLTFDKVLEAIDLKGGDLGKYLDSKLNIESLKKEVMERHERLEGTNSSNFRDRMKEEDKPVVKKKWWHGIFNRKSDS